MRLANVPGANPTLISRLHAILYIATDFERRVCLGKGIPTYLCLDTGRRSWSGIRFRLRKVSRPLWLYICKASPVQWWPRWEERPICGPSSLIHGMGARQCRNSFVQARSSMDGHKVLEACVGWGASTILFATLARQIWVQWREQSTEGLSKWLFVGQVATSIGFVWYSVLVANTLFIVTNSILAVTAVIGQCIYWRNKRLDTKTGKATTG